MQDLCSLACGDLNDTASTGSHVRRLGPRQGGAVWGGLETGSGTSMEEVGY